MNRPKTRSENIVVQELENEILIYDLMNDKAYCLNKTSAMIWQLCDGKNSVAEMSLNLSKKLSQPISEDLIWLALDNFKKDNLLEESQQLEIKFNGLNRRDVIKKIGFASMIALPIVSSVIAPSAAMAQSGLLANNAACTTNSQCQSGNCFGGTKCCVAGTTLGLAPNTRLGAPFSVPSATCTALAAADCCSGNRIWFVTGNCFCG